MVAALGSSLQLLEQVDDGVVHHAQQLRATEHAHGQLAHPAANSCLLDAFQHCAPRHCKGNYREGHKDRKEEERGRTYTETETRQGWPGREVMEQEKHTSTIHEEGQQKTKRGTKRDEKRRQ